MTTGKRLERFGEVRIVDETNGFGLDFVEKTESRFWSATSIQTSLQVKALYMQVRSMAVFCTHPDQRGS